jgi:hypothetical protein
MAFSNSMMQRRLSRNITRINRALMLDQQVNHRHRAHGSSAMNSVLASFVLYTCRSGRLLIEQESSGVNVLFRGDKVKCCLSLVRSDEGKSRR